MSLLLSSRHSAAGLALVALVFATSCTAQQTAPQKEQQPAPQPAQETSLSVGDEAPAFSGTEASGELWSSADHVGQGYVVVYFYPAAMTGGCTAQACAFRDNRSQLQALGAEVVGVSGDRVENLRAFKGSNRLNFPLLSDSTGQTARAFGVPVSDGGTITRTVEDHDMELTRDVTAERWTFIIGPDGRIAYKETEVNPAGDGAAVLAEMERLTQEG